MDTTEILKLINNALPNIIKNNHSYIKLSKIYQDLTRGQAVNDISIRRDLLEKEPKLLQYPNISKISKTIETLFSIFTKDNEFSISFTNGSILIILESMKELEENVYNVVEIEVTIDDTKTLWRTADYHKNKNEYYLDYNLKMYCYNLNGDRIAIEDEANHLDEDFSVTFGIPLEISRMCRLNFAKYRGYINESKEKMIMQSNDIINYGCFIAPFKINELFSILTGIENYESEEEDYSVDAEDCEPYGYEEDYDETDDYEEDDEINEGYEVSDKLIENAKKITSQLELNLGKQGDFIMSINLFDNITDYIMGKVTSLNTTGRFIRNLNGIYTIYYLTFTKNSIIAFPKTATLEEIKAIYEEDPQNAYMEGLKEFFGINKTRKLEE